MINFGDDQCNVYCMQYTLCVLLMYTGLFVTIILLEYLIICICCNSGLFAEFSLSHLNMSSSTSSLTWIRSRLPLAGTSYITSPGFHGEPLVDARPEMIQQLMDFFESLLPWVDSRLLTEYTLTMAAAMVGNSHASVV